VLNRVELGRLLRALEVLHPRRPQCYADCTRLLLLTGVRLSSALGLRREELHDLDGVEARWVVPAERSKSGRAHVVPLSPAALAIVRRRLAAVDGILGTNVQHIFPIGATRAGEDVAMTWSSNWPEDLREEMRPILDTEGTRGPRDPRWTIHSLRHTIATHMLEHLGVSRHVVSLILGHTLPGPAATRVYDRAELLPERPRYPGIGLQMPMFSMTGSTMKHATSPGASALASASGSLYGTTCVSASTPGASPSDAGTGRGAPGGPAESRGGLVETRTGSW